MSRRHSSYYDRYYDLFQDDEEETEDDAFQEIAFSVNRIWRSKWWSKNIHDDESQRKLITAMCARYIYPDYLDLVGSPGSDDYRTKGELTTSRKAELLLIGTFSWQGLTIAKHPSVFGYDRDRWSLSFSPRWGIDDKGWYVSHASLPETLTYDGFITPLQDRQVQKLGDYLVSQEQTLPALHGTIPIDGNVYNCQPENLHVIHLRGRPMRCKGCEKRVTKEGSRIIRLDDSRQRYCFDCIREMASWNEIKTGWW